MNNKKIIFQVTKTYMKQNKKRTAITFSGILVMVVLMTAVFVGKDTIMSFMQKAVEEDKGKWHVQVYDLTADQIKNIENLDCVDKLEVAKPLGYTEFAQSGNPDYTPYLELKGYSGEMFDWMNINLVEGRYPENDHELLISERAVNEGSDIKVGDTIEVDAFRRYIHAFMSEEEEKKVAAGEEIGCIQFLSGFMVEHGETKEVPDHFPNYTDEAAFEMINEPTGLKGTYTVVGIMKSPYYEAQGQGGYIALTKTDSSVPADSKANVVLTLNFKSHQDYQGEIIKIINKYKTPDELKEMEEGGRFYVTDAEEYLPTKEGVLVINDMVLTFAAKGSDTSFNYLMVFFQAFFVILITAASLILIYNVFAISYKERSRYLGMLSSVGATRKQKRWSVYYEVFTLLAFALPFGIIIGLLAVKGAMVLLQPHFASLINNIATNVISGKSCDIPLSLVVNPLNIVIIVIFSIAAVYVSALIPARKISKVGPIESIRGNELTAGRRKKGYKTRFGLMNKGKAERLLSSVSIGRNRYSTKGIIRSITAFVTLTLVTAFAVRSFVDIIKSKTEQEDFSISEHYQNYDYIFSVDDEAKYESGKSDILSSNEVTDYSIMDVDMFAFYLNSYMYSEEYKESVRKIVSSFFPDGIPELVEENYFSDSESASREIFNIITLEDDDFAKVASKAGIDLEKLDESGTFLVYDTISVSTDDFGFSGDGAVKPSYSVYQVKKPLNIKTGESVDFITENYDEETEELNEINIPMTFGGYVAAEDISEYYTLRGENLWIIISESTKDRMYKENEELEGTGISEKYLMFNVNTDDSNLVRRLTQIKDEYGQSALMTAGLITGYTDFKTAITSIVKIVAVCFTLLIAIICLLNLYNSVMGRKIARHQELSVLYSMGMTERQKSKMLILENIRLIIRAFIYSGIITSIFVVCLRKALNARFGRMIFTLPGWIMAATAAVSIAALIIFTFTCYKGTGKKQLIDEIRAEAV